MIFGILIYLIKFNDSRKTRAQNNENVAPTNDFDEIVEKYNGKLEKLEILDALKIMLEKKHHMQITIYSSTYSAFIVVAGFVYGYITSLKASDPLFLGYLIGGFIVFFLLNYYLKKLYKNAGKIKNEYFEQYLDAIMKLEKGGVNSIEK